MPLQEFWNDDPDLLWTYRTSFIKKKEEEIKYQKEMINYQAWLQGLYNQCAIASALSKNVKYYEKPIDFNKTKKQTLVEKIMSNLTKSKEYIEQRREKQGQTIQH